MVPFSRCREVHTNHQDIWWNGERTKQPDGLQITRAILRTETDASGRAIRQALSRISRFGSTKTTPSRFEAAISTLCDMEGQQYRNKGQHEAHVLGLWQNGRLFSFHQAHFPFTPQSRRKKARVINGLGFGRDPVRTTTTGRHSSADALVPLLKATPEPEMESRIIGQASKQAGKQKKPSGDVCRDRLAPCRPPWPGNDLPGAWSWLLGVAPQYWEIRQPGCSKSLPH